MMRRSPLQRKTPMERGASTLARTPMVKRSRPRRPPDYRDQQALDACRNEPCYLMVPSVCVDRVEPGTVVPCHGNWADMGKGGMLKAKDEFTVPGCRACHYWLDFGPAPRAEKRSVFDAALTSWAPVRALKLSQ